MKKIAILGASAALAAMPVVGVFAVDPDTSIVDTLQVTVESSCTFKVDNTTDGMYTKDTLYSDANVAGGSQADFSATHSGSHDFEFTCNDTDGFTITALPTNLTSWNTTTSAAGTGDGVISFTEYSVYSGNTGITGGTERDGKWTAHVTTTDTDAGMTIAQPSSINSQSPTTIVTKSDALGQATFNVEYKVYAGTSTPADTYRGTITYTLAAI